MHPIFRTVVAIAFATMLHCGVTEANEKAAMRSAHSGSWTDSATWSGGKVPAAGDIVLIRSGHDVNYDAKSDDVIRAIHIDGTLHFAADRDTVLNVGLIRVGAGGTTDEEGFDCDAHLTATDTQAALLVGTVEQPIAFNRSATIRLHYVAGMNKESCPAIVDCGGRMEFHGSAMNRTWMKLGAPGKTGSAEVTLLEPVTGWKAGDRVIVTATTRQSKQLKTFRKSVTDNTQTEERMVTAIDGNQLKLDKPLQFDHVAQGSYRGDVANLSRNVVVESADPAGVRGHTMYHQGSTGAISFTEFRHLGKAGVLGRYSLHFHLCGDSMRGASVVGASIWDSDNRWLTVHGTNYLLVRDCVGYRSKGHGFFLEDGTEVNNVFDRNLAVQATSVPALPKQVVPFDHNDGSGFWWANSGNAFTRNVAAECDEYGYFFQGAQTADFNPVLEVRQPGGTRKRTDIRTIPFIRFDDNEAYCQRRHAFNLGGGVPFGTPNVEGVGPDIQHPFIIRNYRAWASHWPIHPVSPSVLIDNIDLFDNEYGIWRPVYKSHAYRDVKFDKVPEKNHYAFVDGNKPPMDPAAYPKPLDPVDDLPPVTVITSVASAGPGKLIVRGNTVDNGKISAVWVNGIAAILANVEGGAWEATLEGVKAGRLTLAAHAKDVAGNEEKTPHQVSFIAQ